MIRALGWATAVASAACFELALVLYAPRLVTLIVSGVALFLVACGALGVADSRGSGL